MDKLLSALALLVLVAGVLFALSRLSGGSAPAPWRLVYSHRAAKTYHRDLGAVGRALRREYDLAPNGAQILLQARRKPRYAGEPERWSTLRTWVVARPEGGAK